jgi:hypothetical protein
MRSSSQAAKEQKAREKAESAAKREAEKKAGATVKKAAKVIDKVAAAKGLGVRATKKPALVS